MKVDNAIRAICENVDKNSAEVMADQPNYSSNAHTRAPAKTTSDMDLNMQENVRTQSLAKGPEKSKAKILFPMTDVVNGTLE